MVTFPISIFSQIRSEGGGHQISFFSQIQNSPHYPRGGGQENYGLFPNFGTFLILTAPLSIKIIFSVYTFFSLMENDLPPPHIMEFSIIF